MPRRGSRPGWGTATGALRADGRQVQGAPFVEGPTLSPTAARLSTTAVAVEGGTAAARGASRRYGSVPRRRLSGRVGGGLVLATNAQRLREREAVKQSLPNVSSNGGNAGSRATSSVGDVASWSACVLVLPRHLWRRCGCSHRVMAVSPFAVARQTTASDSQLGQRTSV